MFCLESGYGAGVILVTHNYHLALDPYARAEQRPYPPLGTLGVASSLRAAGHDVAFWDATFHHDPADFRLGLAAHSPQRVAIVADYHAVPQKMCLGAQRDAAFTMIRLAREQGAEVLVSGPDATDRPQPYLEAGASVVIRGEPDQAVLDWAAGASLESLTGGMTDPTEPLSDPAPPRKQLDQLPLPHWDWIDLPAYARIWRNRHGYWELPISTARGCPYRCNWCAKPIWGRSFQLRPVAAVVAEAREASTYGADQIWFTDDIFALRRDWLSAFREQVEAVGGIPPYRCLSRVDLVVRHQTVADLAASGCIEVWLGVESGSQKVLDAMDKDQTVQQIRDATHQLHSAGIRVGWFLQLGYPEETIDDVLQTLELVRSARPDQIGVSVAYPLPGTPFYERVQDRLIATNWETAMDCALLYEGRYDQPFYDAARGVLRHHHAAGRGMEAIRGLLSGQSRAFRPIATLPSHVARLPLLHARMRWHARQERHE